MQFTTLLFAAAALIGVNAVNLTNTDYTVTAGKSFSIGWAGASGPVTLTLKNGPALNLQTVSTITSGASTSPFEWTVPSDLPAGNYAIEISDGTATNYSLDFGLSGATASASASSASSTSASASASSSASVSSSASTSAASSSANSTSSASSSSATSASNSTASTTGSASKTSSGSSSSKTSAGASSSSSVPNANSASEFASPLALVFLTFAAIFSLN